MSLTIIGLGVLGTSLGLALKSAISQMQIVGHDPEPVLTAQAKKLGAIDKSHWNLPAACEQADIVLLDLPYPQVLPTLRVLAESLSQDALVIDFAPSKQALLSQSADELPALNLLEAYIVPAAACQDTWTPSADLLKDAAFFLAVGQHTSERAVKVAAGLAEAVGAKPIFTSADELDSLIAAGSQLPLILATAIMSVWQRTGGWQDRQRALAATSRWATRLMEGNPELTNAALWENRAALAGWLARAIEQLQAFHSALSDANTVGLDTLLSQVRHDQDALSKASHEEPEFDKTEITGFQQLFLGSLGRRLRGKR